MNEMATMTTSHKVSSREAWLAARESLLVREKEHTGDGILSTG